jgi:tRNA 2-thiouridine synthesizing protein C
MIQSTIHLLIHSSLLSGDHFKESLDLALTCAVFDLPVYLVFIDNGVYNLLSQKNTLFNEKNHLAILKGLDCYDIQGILVEIESLTERHIHKNDIIYPCSIITQKELNQRHQHCHHLITLS